MDVKTFEVAQLELRDLIFAQGATESNFQDWFEKHRIIFDVLGYKEVIPHPKLTEDGRILMYKGELLIPDFMAQRLDGFWAIIELKRPDTPILRKRKHRSGFYQDMNTYYEQCCEYSEYFDDEAHRKEFREAYGVEVQKNPPVILIAGRTEKLDRRKVYQILSRRTKVTHQTYDDIFETLEFYRVQHFGRYENIRGLSVHFVIVIYPSLDGKENFIVDIGTREDVNRVSIYLDSSGRLSFRVRDAEAEEHLIHSNRNRSGFNFGELSYLCFQVGIGEDYAVLSIEVNGKEHVFSTLPGFCLQLDDFYYVMGSDVRGKAWTNMALAENIVYSRTLSFVERTQLRDYVFEKFKTELFSINLPNRVEFRGHKFLHSQNHPNFEQSGAVE